MTSNNPAANQDDRRRQLEAQAEQCGMKTVPLCATHPPASAAGLIPAATALRYRVVPLQKNGEKLELAIGDPLDLETIDTLQHIIDQPVEMAAALPEEIDQTLERLYTTPTPAPPTPQQTAPDDEPIIRLVNALILEAHRLRASDLHLEPLGRRFRVRYRIDGVLREIEGPPQRLHPSVISRLKIMADMKISEKRLPQDGRIALDTGNHQLDLRVSSIPTNHGESMVLRILDKVTLTPGLPHLGFMPDDQQAFENLVHRPDGIVLVTGPTGSGKTTTLYACLNHLNQPDRKIITVEDPVEYRIRGINQVRIRPNIGLSFAEALRSIMRQAPNTIMIGEIRDRETAEIAINAALTGHLVLSTLHTNDAPSAVTRLTDIGTKPFLISSALRGVMAQRLVRTICDQCKTAYEPGRAEAQLINKTLFKGNGCKTCGQTGYLGRKGLFEVLQVNETIRQLIYERAATADLRAQARACGMHTLREDGLRKAAAGTTTLAEVLRVTMRNES